MSSKHYTLNRIDTSGLVTSGYGVREVGVTDFGVQRVLGVRVPETRRFP